jgi:hypothetical protein
MTRLATVCALALVCACGDDTDDGDAAVEEDMDAAVEEDTDAAAEESVDAGRGDAGGGVQLGFFVSSDTSSTGNLGGLAGADARCQALAEAVGAGERTWRAYLSAEKSENDDDPIHARDRIGTGPWYNAAGELVAADLDSLHERSGDAEVFLDEQGNKINGQWPESPDPNEHDILTGTGPDGRVLVGFTCSDWTSDSGELTAQVGHSDGLGPEANPEPPYNSWHSSHESGGCDDTAPRGGAGRIYCFASD